MGSDCRLSKPLNNNLVGLRAFDIKNDSTPLVIVVFDSSCCASKSAGFTSVLLQREFEGCVFWD